MYWEGVNVGLYGKGRYVSWLQQQGVCSDNPCTYDEEHYSFDGQVFYREEKK